MWGGFPHTYPKSRKGVEERFGTTVSSSHLQVLLQPHLYNANSYLHFVSSSIFNQNFGIAIKGLNEYTYLRVDVAQMVHPVILGWPLSWILCQLPCHKILCKQTQCTNNHHHLLMSQHTMLYPELDHKKKLPLVFSSLEKKKQRPLSIPSIHQAQEMIRLPWMMHQRRHSSYRCGTPLALAHSMHTLCTSQTWRIVVTELSLMWSHIEREGGKKVLAGLIKCQEHEGVKECA